MAMSDYETIIWEEKMKEQIKCKHYLSSCYMHCQILITTF